VIASRRHHIDDRSVAAALREMTECCDMIESYTQDVSESDFRSDRMRQDAVIRQAES
jgi:uncharacterized protein with HEPN domain